MSDRRNPDKANTSPSLTDSLLPAAGLAVDTISYNSTDHSYKTKNSAERTLRLSLRSSR